MADSRMGRVIPLVPRHDWRQSGTPREDAECELEFPFANDSYDFCLGFEIGRLWEQMSRGDEQIRATCHRDNARQIQLMAERKGYVVDWVILDEYWMDVTARLKGER